ncbi:MAG: Hint domain-containing protein [Rhodobacterales bacterium]|nr:Hint domain-containing protein [Rhodobacterales bacterium]
MPTYTLDWSTATADGDNVLTSGGTPVTVGVSTPVNFAGEEASILSLAAWGGEALGVTSVQQFTEANLTFSTPAENVTFQVFDLDQVAGQFDDRIKIFAYDENGQPLDIQLSDLTHHIDYSNGAEAGGQADPAINGAGSPDTITVTIPGPVSSIQIFYATGDSATTTSTFAISDITFHCNPALDGIVEGTAGDDLIDLAYTGDPEGDRIDAGDAIDPAACPNDDVVIAGDGNDTIIPGRGRDVVYAGAGNDVLTGSVNADTLYGEADRDTFIGHSFGDVIDGGSTGDDFDTLVLDGLGKGGRDYRVVDTVTDSDGNGIDGRVEILDGAGNVTGSFTFTNIEEVICFTPGTLIATPRGEVPVEDLREGDKVITRDNGIQELCWIGRKALDWRALAAAPHLKPVLIRQGSLGNGLPERDMMVSPNHRMLVANERTALYFDEHEVLVAAKHLVNNRGVHVVDSMGTTYLHVMCERHEVLLANGAWTESFQPGDWSLKGLGNAQRNELLELFPELRTEAGVNGYAAARRTLKRHEARLLAR